MRLPQVGHEIGKGLTLAKHLSDIIPIFCKSVTNTDDVSIRFYLILLYFCKRNKIYNEI